MKHLLILLAAATLWAQNPADQDTLRAKVQKYVDARDAQDPQSVEALFTPDADQLVSTGVWRKGRAEVVRGTLASTRNNEGKRTLTVDSIRFVTPDVALVDCRYEISGATTRKMWSSFVFVRAQDGWRISAIRNMLPAR
jgi:uncharacterized protein (TIGR02246 family)